MSTRKVRVGEEFYFVPVLLDKVNPPTGNLRFGDYVRVINLHGCPPANTMGMCYVENVLTKKFSGLICTNSLYTHEEYKEYLKTLLAKKGAA